MGRLDFTKDLKENLAHGTGAYPESTEPFKPNALTPLIEQLRDLAKLRRADHDEGALAIMDHYSSKSFRMKTDATLGEFTGTIDTSITPTRRMCASAVVHCDKMDRRDRERVCANLIAAGVAAGLHYADGARYDESKFKVTKGQIAPRPTTMPESGQQLALAMGSSDLGRALAVRPGTVGKYDMKRQTKDVAAAKLFQCKSEYVGLLKFDESLGLDERERYCILKGFSADWLQSVQRMTGRCVRELLTRGSSVSEHVGGFKLKSRVAGSDRHGSNKVGELAL
jgi:hypothetical protein